MNKEQSAINEIGMKPRGWDALEIRLKQRGLSGIELEEAHKSFYDGIEVLSKMFLVCYSAEKNE